MRKINLAVISDVLFFTLCAFLIGFSALRYYIKSVGWALAVAALIAAPICLISLYLTLKKRERLIATTIGEGERKLLALHLSTLPPDKLTAMFLDAFDGTYAVGNHIEDEKSEYRFCFKITPLSCDDVAYIIKEREGKQLVICCCAATAEAVQLVNDFGVGLKCIGELYPLLKKKELLPESYPFNPSVKKGVLSKIKKRFNRRLCPSLFFSGLFLLIYSFFSFYPIWYIVTGSILTFLSALCLFFGERA